MRMEAFQRLVSEALEGLPDEIREKLDNVDIVVADWPDQGTLQRAGLQHPVQLLGFYHGVPQTKRRHHYGLVLPDKITVYRGPIEMQSSTTEQTRAIVRRVVRHEIAHHLGIDDERLREIGAY